MKKSKPEEAFYENLTLNLKNTLLNVPRICDVRFEMRQPCEKAQVINWEQRHSVYLPEDMKKFYLSTDGFTLQWSYQYAADDTRRVGLINFPHLLQITLLRENVETAHTSNGISTSTPCNKCPSTSPQPKDTWGNPTPVLTPKSKIFELNNVNDVAKVCLLYESTGTSNPKIYLLELNDFRWQFLAESFSEYLRMSIAHLGLPYWELCFASFGLPSWSNQLFLLLAPHLLGEHEKRRSRIIQPAAENPYNVLDPNVFRMKPKGVAKSSTTGKNK